MPRYTRSAGSAGRRVLALVHPLKVETGLKSQATGIQYGKGILRSVDNRAAPACPVQGRGISLPSGYRATEINRVSELR
jgi:hypothetical protein